MSNVSQRKVTFTITNITWCSIDAIRFLTDKFSFPCLSLSFLPVLNAESSRSMVVMTLPLKSIFSLSFCDLRSIGKTWIIVFDVDSNKFTKFKRSPNLLQYTTTIYSIDLSNFAVNATFPPELSHECPITNILCNFIMQLGNFFSQRIISFLQQSILLLILVYFFLGLHLEVVRYYNGCLKVGLKFQSKKSISFTQLDWAAP